MRSSAVLVLALLASCLEPTVEVRRGAAGPDAAVEEPAAETFEITKCATAADCAGGVCHPVANLCAVACEADADCPRAEPHCAKLKEADTGGKLCQCQSNDECGAFVTGSVCSPTDHVCEPGCVADSDCAGYFAGRTCDAKTRVCRL